jgi:hypothetical protein
VAAVTSESPQRSRWEPTWRRLVGSTVVVFLVILAFLVGRVRAGADPGLERSATPAPQSAPPAASGGTSPGGAGAGDPQAQGTDPSDPFGGQADPNADPGTDGTGDNFGNAVPEDGSGGTQNVDPPSTHVS